MSKREALEQLREAIRQARVQRDLGDNSAHGRVLFFTGLVNHLSSLKGESAKQWIAARTWNQ